MPGMIDSHAHPLTEGVNGGLTLINLSFPDEGGDVAKLTKFVSQHLKDHGSHQGDVLVIAGLDIGYWAHAAEVDAALSSGKFADTPIALWGSDGHTGWANPRCASAPASRRSSCAASVRISAASTAPTPN